MFPPELPPVKNRLLYSYRVFAKWLSFFVFGLFMGILGAPIFLLMRLLIHPKKRFNKYARLLVSYAMRSFVFFMRILCIVKLEVKDRKAFRNFSSKIVVANHPSLLDVVMLLSLIPNADCIVNAYLKRNILTGVVLQLYILNSEDFDKVTKACGESLKIENCLIIFPEGTRTPRSGKVVFKRGAARIALASGCNIVPVHIGGTDKFGLGKKDPFTGFNPTERYIYEISVMNEIDVQQYKNLPAPIAARALTNEIKAVLFPEKQ